MPEGEIKGRQDFPPGDKEEYLGTRLYTLTGEGSERKAEIIREIEKTLSVFPEFIGLSLHGSVFGGFSRNSSDIDAFILVDKSRISPEKSSSGPSNNFIEEYNRLKKIYPNEMKGVTVLQVNQQKISQELKWVRGKNLNDFHPLLVGNELFALSLVTTGNEVNEYRQMVIEEIATWSDDERENFIKIILEDIAWREEQDIETREKRIKSIPRSGHQSILAERKKLWERRLEVVWDFKKPESYTKDNL